MTRQEIITALEQFFSPQDLVCQHTYQHWGDNAWQFLNTDYLHALLVIRRDILQRPMICNTKDMHQRGLRCNRCDIVKNKRTVYLSPHVLGKAGDFTVIGLTAEEARRIIKQNAGLLPVPIRMEAIVSWLHIDTLPHADIFSDYDRRMHNKEKIYLFHP